MRHLLSHIIDVLTSPIVVMLILLFIALLLRWRGRPRAAFRTAASGVVLLYLSAIQPVTSLLVGPLVSPFPPLNDAHLPQNIAGVAVLGAVYTPHDGFQMTSSLLF
jgi:hypothetical protein